MRKFQEQELEFKTAKQEEIHGNLVKKFVGVESSVVATPNRLSEMSKSNSNDNLSDVNPIQISKDKSESKSKK